MRRPVSALAVAAALLSAAPAAAGPAEQLEQAENELAGVAARLTEAREAFAAARERLHDLQSRLAGVEHQLAAAAASEQAALRQHDAALADATEAAAQLQTSRGQLSQRAREIYLRGVTDPASAVLSALGAGEGAHEVAVATTAARRLLERDQQLVHDAVAAQRLAEAARGRADQAARTAAAQRATAEALVRQQRGLVAQAEQVRAEQARVLADLLADQRAQQQLIEELRRRLLSVEAVLRDPRSVPFDQPAPDWAGSLPAAGQRWAGAVDAAAARAGLDGRFLAALVWTESSFRPDVISPAGAIGLTQLMPATAAALGVDPHDPIDNLTGGARYLRTLLQRYWDLELGLAAYHSGPADVAPGGQVGVASQLYVLIVLERWQRVTGANSS
ncbi:MAG TPA: lytic transglycosylase domain-containing protein [Nitriliruptorales bacterium]|nr:lytic transglycosylase domain-containing protein [Nitriliruptorales bacterium]